MKIVLNHVYYIPKELEEGIFYFSKEFETASHLCPCGCKNKIVTPIGPVDWLLEERNGTVSLYPSIGNWQIPCRSHYWIKNGGIVWARQWSIKEIKEGRKLEQQIRKKYFKTKNKGLLHKLMSKWFFNL